MKRLIVWLVPVLLLCLFLVAVGFNKMRYSYGWPDAIKRTVMTPFTGTLWADGFTEAKFSKVSVGMTADEVKSLLGPPLKEWCSQGKCAWLYSWQDTPTADYDRRSVSFDRSGCVDGIWRNFFID